CSFGIWSLRVLVDEIEDALDRLRTAVQFVRCTFESRSACQPVFDVWGRVDHESGIGGIIDRDALLLATEVVRSEKESLADRKSRQHETFETARLLLRDEPRPGFLLDVVGTVQ